MKLLKRIIVSFYLVIIIFLSILLISIPLDLIDLIELKANYLYNYYIVGIGIFTFIISLIELLRGIFKNSNKFITVSNEYGKINVSDKALIGLINLISSKVNGFSNLNTKVSIKNNEIFIILKGLVGENVNIPETGLLLQNKIKEYIETHTGLIVSEIKISIHNVHTQKIKN